MLQKHIIKIKFNKGVFAPSFLEKNGVFWQFKGFNPYFFDVVLLS